MGYFGESLRLLIKKIMIIIFDFEKLNRGFVGAVNSGNITTPN